MRILSGRKAPIYFVAAGMLAAVAACLPMAGWLYRWLSSHNAAPDTVAGLTFPFFSVVVLSVFAILLFLTGAIQWIRAVAATPVRPRARAAGDEGWWKTGCHLAALAGYLFPFGHIIGPFAVWAVGRRDSAEVDREGRTSLNFQISITIFVLIAVLLSVVFIGALLLPAILTLHVLSTIWVAARVKRGAAGRYPVSLEIISSQ